MIDSIIPLILILLYITFIMILNYLKDLYIKKDKKELDYSLNPEEVLYTYSFIRFSKLFKIALLNLINRGYYKLEKVDDLTIIKINNRKNSKSLNEEQLRAYKYVNEFVKDGISLEKLSDDLDLDPRRGHMIDEYGKDLKRCVKKNYGFINRSCKYLPALIFMYFYSTQVLYFFNVGFSTSDILLLSIPCAFILIIFTSLFANRFIIANKKHYIYFYLTSILLSLPAFHIWKELYNYDLVVFHVCMAFLTFMFPVALYTNLYLESTNTFNINKNQEDVINKMNSFKFSIMKKDIVTKEEFPYALGLGIKREVEDELLMDFKDKFNL